MLVACVIGRRLVLDLFETKHQMKQRTGQIGVEEEKPKKKRVAKRKVKARKDKPTKTKSKKKKEDVSTEEAPPIVEVIEDSKIDEAHDEVAALEVESSVSEE